MTAPGSITALVERLKGGDQEAVRLLWQRYYPRLVALARRKLQGDSRRVADEEKSLPVMDGPRRCGDTSWRTPRVDSPPYHFWRSDQPPPGGANGASVTPNQSDR